MLRAEDRAVDPRTEIRAGLQQAGALVRHGRERLQCPVAEQQRGDRQNAAAQAEPEHQRRREQERDCDALQHARDPQIRQVQEIRERVQQQAEQEDDRRPLRRARRDVRAFGAPRDLHRERVRHGHADNEQEERKDQVRRRPAVPLRVPQRRVDRAPAPRIVDDQHARDRETAERVQGDEARALRLRRGYCCPARSASFFV